MYLKKIQIRNTGPISSLDIDLVEENQRPKPIIFVGRNGAGKSVLIAQVVSAILNAHNACFNDSDLEQGKVFKLRSPQYIRTGAPFSYSCLDFTNGFYDDEICLISTRDEYLKVHPPVNEFRRWSEKFISDNSSHASNFSTVGKPKLQRALQGPHLYFPPNRFEEPAWLNESNLRNKAEYFNASAIAGDSDRPVIQYSPLKQNQSWILDVLYDHLAIETVQTVVDIDTDPTIRRTGQGPASTIVQHLNSFLGQLLGTAGKLSWYVGSRSRRRIGIVSEGEGVVTGNLFSLSSGQAALLNLFLTIYRHADLSGQVYKNSLPSDITGMVIIDEVDLHLHSDLKYGMLPALIKMFSGIQFILTTHSPTFLLGMQKEFGSEGFKVVELPNGNQISVEDFREFEASYQYFSNTHKFEKDVANRVSNATKPLLFVEGTTDIDYLRKAAELLGYSDLLDGFNVYDGNGYKGLDKIWKNYSDDRWNNPLKPLVLLYDCDVNKQDAVIGKAYRRIIPLQENPIVKGIENLFTSETIEKAKNQKPAFFDHSPEYEKTVRGETVVVPEALSINSNEKRNLCNWLCSDGTSDDFQRFSVVFDLLDAIVSDRS